MDTTIDVTDPVNPINVTPFNQAEARRFTDELKQDVDRLGAKLLEGYRRKVWKALNFANFVDYCQVELGESKTNAYRLLDVARVTDSLFPEFGKEATKIPINQRELLLKVPAEQRSPIFKAAIDEARLEGKAKPTAMHVRRVVSAHLGLPVKNQPNSQDQSETEVDDRLTELQAAWEQQAAEIEGLRAQLEEKDQAIAQLQREVLDLMDRLKSDSVGEKPSLGVGAEVGKRLEGWRGFVRKIEGDRCWVWWTGEWVGKGKNKEEKLTAHRLADLCPFPRELVAVKAGQTLIPR